MSDEELINLKKDEELIIFGGYADNNAEDLIILDKDRFI